MTPNYLVRCLCLVLASSFDRCAARCAGWRCMQFACSEGAGLAAAPLSPREQGLSVGQRLVCQASVSCNTNLVSHMLCAFLPAT